MSLSRREQLLLDRTAAALGRDDPGLTAKFAVFGGAAGGAPVPGHERLPSGPARRLRAWRHPRGSSRAAGPPAPAGAPGPVQEDTMPVNQHISPLPPDRAGHGQSPLPPDPARGGSQPGSRVRRDQSPLPPDPGPECFPAVPRPRPAPDDPGQAGNGRPGGEPPGCGPDRPR